MGITNNHTFMRRFPVGIFIDIDRRMIREWGMEDDSLLFKTRNAVLFEDGGLKLRTEGYQWFRQLKQRGTNKLIQVNPKGKYTLCESSEHMIGKVDMIYVVASSNNKLTTKSLKELAKLRLKKRVDPMY
jgi:hypothetical protein